MLEAAKFRQIQGAAAVRETVEWKRNDYRCIRCRWVAWGCMGRVAGGHNPRMFGRHPVRVGNYRISKKRL